MSLGDSSTIEQLYLEYRKAAVILRGSILGGGMIPWV